MRFENALDPHVARRIWYMHPRTMSNKQIGELFDISSATAIARVKAGIREVMYRNGRRVWNGTLVDTRSAFEFAGITIEEVEQQCEAMRKFAETERRRLNADDQADAFAGITIEEVESQCEAMRKSAETKRRHLDAGSQTE